MHPTSFPFKRAGTFSALSMTSPLRALLPYAKQLEDTNRPKRKSLEVPTDHNTFIKPLKQSFVKNPRMMPMTRVMLSLLSGWAGDGKALETTTGIIAKHLGRCRRQVFRYLKDAMEEGYLSYTRTKDRIGRYTGLRIWLNFPAIRYSNTRKKPKTAKKLAMTLKSETNKKLIYNRNTDEEMWDRIAQFASLTGLDMPTEPPG